MVEGRHSLRTQRRGEHPDHLNMPDGLQTGDVVRMTFSGGIATLEKEIEPLAATDQLRALEGG